jgi:hypothetical protein
MSFASAGASGGGERTLSTLLRGLKTGVFGTLAVLQKKEKPRKPWLVYALAIIQFFQMLHFVRKRRERGPSASAPRAAAHAFLLPIPPPGHLLPRGLHLARPHDAVCGQHCFLCLALELL